MKIGPKYKICRRLGSRVFGKCQTTKFSISGSAKTTSRKARRGRSLSDYGAQLIEKQKARYTYGLKERQFASYVVKARSLSALTHNPATALYQKLESRLDNVVFRLGLAPSRPAARQLVTHGHIMVNGRRLNIPSYQVALGDLVTPRPESLRLPIFRNREEGETPVTVARPTWLEFDVVARAGKKIHEPVLGQTEIDLNFGSILEFYSRV